MDTQTSNEIFLHKSLLLINELGSQRKFYKVHRKGDKFPMKLDIICILKDKTTNSIEVYGFWFKTIYSYNQDITKLISIPLDEIDRPILIDEPISNKYAESISKDRKRIFNEIIDSIESLFPNKNYDWVNN